jgi:hypothetical protein
MYELFEKAVYALVYFLGQLWSISSFCGIPPPNSLFVLTTCILNFSVMFWIDYIHISCQDFHAGREQRFWY